MHRPEAGIERVQHVLVIVAVEHEFRAMRLQHLAELRRVDQALAGLARPGSGG